MRGERLAALTKELDEMTTEGRSDADMAAIRRAKHELEMKVKDQVRISLFYDEMIKLDSPATFLFLCV
jgi:predicted ATP-binding protein involved in virulence